MPRLIDQPITPTLVKDAFYGEMRPASFAWRGSRYRVVAILDRWSETGQWWNLQPPMTVWRVQLHDQGVMELASVHKQPPEWRLLVIFD